MRQRRKLLIAAAALAMLAVLPQAAIAQTPDTDPGATAETDLREPPRSIAEIKIRALAAIDKRLAALDRIGAKVRSDAHVTEEHAGLLQAHYARTVDGLRGLASEIRAADTREALKELVPLIAEDYRVYLVIIPKTHEVLVSDRMADAVDRLTDIVHTLTEAIERAEEAGFDMTEARRLLGIAIDEIDAVERGAVPVADSVVGLTAADWEEPAKSLLAEGKHRLEAGRQDIHDAIDALTKTRRAIYDTIG